jgi:hypothetical protein
MKCTIVKKSTVKKMGAKLTKGAAAPISFQFTDNENATFTVNGVDASGAAVDISGVATLTATSDTPAVMTVGPVTGMGSSIQGVGPGTANLILVATWNDGSVGPFTLTVPVTVTGGTATGLSVTFGTPTVTP